MSPCCFNPSNRDLLKIPDRTVILKYGHPDLNYILSPISETTFRHCIRIFLELAQPDFYSPYPGKKSCYIVCCDPSQTRKYDINDASSHWKLCLQQNMIINETRFWRHRCSNAWLLHSILENTLNKTLLVFLNTQKYY